MGEPPRSTPPSWTSRSARPHPVAVSTDQLDDALVYWSKWKTQPPKLLMGSLTSSPEPIGYLHLERLSFVPAGVEHGELVYSLPLSPGENVAIVHKEWSNTDEELTQLMADQFEDFSERGVVDKTDMAEASLMQRQQASSFAVAVAASGGYGPVSATVSTGYQTAQADTASRQASLNRLQTITQKASSRSRREHRTTFRLAKKTQVDDETVRLIKNPDPFHPVRYDFYRLMRKWRVNLHRYGVRLTYDLTIPEPAVDLMEIYAELEELENLLEKGFEFALAPEALTRHTWQHYANLHGADVEPPPPVCLSVQVTKLSGPFMGEERKQQHLDELHIAVPEGYAFRFISARRRADLGFPITIHVGQRDLPAAGCRPLFVNHVLARRQSEGITHTRRLARDIRRQKPGALFRVLRGRPLLAVLRSRGASRAFGEALEALEVPIGPGV